MNDSISFDRDQGRNMSGFGRDKNNVGPLRKRVYADRCHDEVEVGEQPGLLWKAPRKGKRVPPRPSTTWIVGGGSGGVNS